MVDGTLSHSAPAGRGLRSWPLILAVLVVFWGAISAISYFATY